MLKSETTFLGCKSIANGLPVHEVNRRFRSVNRNRSVAYKTRQNALLLTQNRRVFGGQFDFHVVCETHFVIVLTEPHSESQVFAAPVSFLTRAVLSNLECPEIIIKHVKKTYYRVCRTSTGEDPLTGSLAIRLVSFYGLFDKETRHVHTRLRR